MATLTITIDSDVKADADKLYKSMGMNLTTAINVFLRKSLQVGGMPFTPTAGIRGVWVNPSDALIPRRSTDGAPILPADWDDEEDSVYDSLYS